MKKFMWIVVCVVMILISLYGVYNSVYLAAGPHTETDYTQTPYGVEKEVGWNYPKAIKRCAAIVVPGIVGTVILVIIAKHKNKKKKQNDSEYSQSIVNADGSREEIPSNMWKCSKCGKVNANFCSVCTDCGAVKVRDN